MVFLSYYKKIKYRHLTLWLMGVGSTPTIFNVREPWWLPRGVADWMYRKFQKFIQNRLKKNLSRRDALYYAKKYWNDDQSFKVWYAGKLKNWRKCPSVLDDSMLLYFKHKINMYVHTNRVYFIFKLMDSSTRASYKDYWFMSARLFCYIAAALIVLELFFIFLRRPLKLNDTYNSELILLLIDMFQFPICFYIYTAAYINFTDFHRCYTWLIYILCLVRARVLLDRWLDYHQDANQPFDARIALFNYYVPIFIWYFVTKHYWIHFGNRAHVDIIEVYLNGCFLISPSIFFTEYENYCWHRHTSLIPVYPEFDIKYSDYFKMEWSHHYETSFYRYYSLSQWPYNFLKNLLY